MTPRGLARTASELAAGVLFLYFSVWVYEAGNFAASALVGESPRVLFNGLLPAGVVSLGTSPWGPLAKPIQLALTLGALFLLLRGTRGLDVPLVKLSILFALSAFLASAYWELLQAPGGGLLSRTAVFALSASGISALLLVRMRRELFPPA